MKSYIYKIKKLSEKKDFEISVAESCTGGMLSKCLTSIDGSSKYFNGSVVSYSNYFKNKLLDVPKNIIKQHGAVSHQTALCLVKGLGKKCNSEILISVTGVAGPKSGSTKTPIGCVYFGIGTKIKSKYRFKTEKKLFKQNSRNKIQEESTKFALKIIIQEIKKI